MNQEGQKHFAKPPQSFWIASTSNYDYPSLDEDLKVDVAIVGGGITGILCAYFLSQKGVRVAILEADRILRGTTGHTTAKITSQHGLIYNKLKTQVSEELARQYAEANETAIRMYEGLINKHDIDCDFFPESAYVYTQRDGYVSKIQDEVNVASSFGIEATFLEEIPLNIPIKAAVRFDNQARFHPRKFLLALSKEIVDKGGKIFEHSKVVDIEENGGYVLITHQGKKISAEKVIIASHYPFYNKHGLYFTRIYSERSYVIAVRAKEDYPGGMYITAEEPGRSLRSQPSNEGELLLIGGEHHKTGQSDDTIKHYEALVNFAHETFTVEDIPYRWSTQDCMTLDGLPYAGYYTSDTPNLFIATGYKKWGMTNSMASSILLTDLIIDGESPWQDAYNPSRETTGASLKTFVVENLNVAKELIGGKIWGMPEDADIKKGEGKIIEANGQKAGAYRDEEGTLHVVDTTCTHMGCELTWNSAEKSWDCPCHGSRFTYEGEVIEGPALRPLDIHDVNTVEKLIKDDF